MAHTTLPPRKKALSYKWVHKIKCKSDGNIKWYKACLVILRNTQVEGLNYTNTFALVAKMATFHTVLSVVAAGNWEIHQIDVHNPFLHGDLQDEVYMKFPIGFSKGHEGKVYKFQKSLYGLKQAPRCWFGKLTGLTLISP